MRWFKSKYKKVKVPFWIVHVICKGNNLRFEGDSEMKAKEFAKNITEDSEKEFFVYSNGAIRRNEIRKIEIEKDYRIKRVRKNLKEVIKKSEKKKS